MDNGYIEFSVDGNFLAICDPENSLLNIYQISLDGDLEVFELKNLVENGRNLICFDGKASANSMNLSFIERIKFDKFNQYLIGFGGTEIFILNLKSNIGEILSVKSSIFEQINDASILSDSDTVRCLVACKKKNLKQVSVFNIL